MDSTHEQSACPVGRTATKAAASRAAANEEYGAARDEDAAIRELRGRNWIAAHIRERRYELELTQVEVAERAGTSHSFISKAREGRPRPDHSCADPNSRRAR